MLPIEIGMRYPPISPISRPNWMKSPLKSPKNWVDPKPLWQEKPVKVEKFAGTLETLDVVVGKLGLRVF